MAERPPNRLSTRALVGLALGASLAVNAALLALLLWQPGTEPPAGKAKERPKKASSASESESAERSPERIERQLRKQRASVRDLSPEQRVRRLTKQLEPLAEIPQRRVERIARAAEKAAGVETDEGAWQPDPDAEGAFDPDTASVHRIERVDGEDGTRYVWTLVDRAGRTLEHAVPAERMSGPERAAYRIFSLAEENPRLRRLLESARRIAHTRMRARHGAATRPDSAAN
jgi:hypothetical protein